MRRLPLAIALGLAAVLALPAAAQTTVAKAKTTAKSRQAAESEAKGRALAEETVEQISANQLEIAQRVLTGRAECEFNQNVQVDPVTQHPGHFHVAFAKRSFTMVPEETTTGAVRLVDRKAGVIWLQIPVKSMLIDTKAGHRLVDACMHAEQRAAVDAAKGAAQPNSLQ